jgi:hypothetical protein
MNWPTAEFMETARRRGRDKPYLKFSANPSIYLFGYAYLMHKYKSTCFVPTEVSIHYQSGAIVSPVDRAALARDLLHCARSRGTRAIFLLLTILINANVVHVNVLIYRPFQNAVERYDPHGREILVAHADESKINVALAKMFEVEFRPILREFTPAYYPPFSVCPENAEGFQAIENEFAKDSDEGPGYCQMWALFMIETVLLNPTLSTAAILEKCLAVSDKNPRYVTDLIRGYVHQISEEMHDYYTRNKVLDIQKLFLDTENPVPEAVLEKARELGARTARRVRATSPTARTPRPRGMTVAQMTKIDKKVRKLTQFDARTYLMDLKGVPNRTPKVPPKGTTNYRRTLKQLLVERGIPWEELERRSPEVAGKERAASPTSRQVQKLSNYDAYKYFLRLSGNSPANPMPKLNYEKILRGELRKRGMTWGDMMRQFYGDSETSSLAPQESDSLEATPKERSPLVLRDSTSESLD